LERVARRARDDRAASERLAELRDVDLDGVRGRLRGVVAPEVVDEAVARDDAAEIEREVGEERARLRAAERDRDAARARLDRAEQEELELEPPVACVTHRKPPRSRVASQATRPLPRP